jgi:hypothetical protein
MRLQPVGNRRWLAFSYGIDPTTKERAGEARAPET